MPEFRQDFEFVVAALVATGQNYYSDGAIPRPQTLAEAFNRVSRYRVAASSEPVGYGPMTTFFASSRG